MRSSVVVPRKNQSHALALHYISDTLSIQFSVERGEVMLEDFFPIFTEELHAHGVKVSHPLPTPDEVEAVGSGFGSPWKNILLSF